MIIRIRPPYAATEADADKSRAQIDKLLRNYGIEQIQWNIDYPGSRLELNFIVEAELEGVRKKLGFHVVPPLFVARRRTYNPKTGRHDIINAPNWAQSMRLLYHWLKAKIEAVAYGLTTVEQEFLSQAVMRLSDGRQTTVGEALTESMKTGQLMLEAQAPTIPARSMQAQEQREAALKSP